jgi:alpha-L-fucosidase
MQRPITIKESGYPRFWRIYIPWAIGLLWAAGVSMASELSPGESGLTRLVDVRPHPRQLAWQRRELSAFIHFGMNTFTGREWGTGQENPDIFNPRDLNCDQWVSAAKSFGARAVVITAKHHDGFCLWPTESTEHSVKLSPWKEGKGDLIMEVAAACRKAGLALGIYLSPADLHEPSFSRDLNAYNRYFKLQLTELLSKYGPVCEVWFDGADPSGWSQKLDFPGYYKLIRTLQPDAVIVCKGPDVRWVGNEDGEARQSEWSAVPLPCKPEVFAWDDMLKMDLGGRGQMFAAPYCHWYPAVADVSLRSGWFWRPRSEADIKSLRQLVTIYEHSLGRNASLILNITPDTTGLIPEADVQRLAQFGKVLNDRTANNLAEAAYVRSNSTQSPLLKHAASHVLDSDFDTYWLAAENARYPELEIELRKPATFNRILLQEAIQEGQRIEKFAVDAKINGAWWELAAGTTVGYQRILSFEPVVSDLIRIRILESRSTPALATIRLFSVVEF